MQTQGKNQISVTRHWFWNCLQ